MAEQWDQFARAILPKDCSTIQRQEMRRAFYAGAQSIWFIVITSLSTEKETTEKDLEIMNDLHEELNNFTKLVTEGRV